MAKKIHLKKNKAEKIHRFVRLVQDNGIKVSRVILFGSYAKGKENADSDIDIVIVSSQFGADTIEEMMSLRRIAIRVDSHIEPIPLAPRDFKDRYSALIQEIKAHGVDMEEALI